MIEQLIFFMLMFLIGYLFICKITPTISSTMLIAFAPLIGMCVFVFIFILSIILPVSTKITTLILFTIILYFILMGIRYYCDKQIKILPNSFRLRDFLVGFFIFGTLAVLLIIISNVTIGTDAYITLGLSNYLASGGIPSEYFFYARQIFIPALHSSGLLFGLDNINAIYPVISMWFLFILYVFVFRIFSIYKIKKLNKYILSLLVTSSLASIGMYLKHSFYVGDNLFSGIFFTLTVISLFFFKLENKKDWLVISSVFLAFFTLLRMENIFIAFIPIILFLKQNVPNKKENIFLFFGMYFIIILPWFVYGLYRILDIWGYEILHFIDKGPKLLTVITVAVSYFLFLFFVIFYSVYGKHRRIITKQLNWILTLVLLSAIIMGMYFFPEKSGESIYATIINIFNVNEWGITWGSVIFLFLFVTIFTENEEKDFFLQVIFGAIAISFLTVYGRSPFRVGVGDSFNRMLLLVTPIIVIYCYIGTGIFVQTFIDR